MLFLSDLTLVIADIIENCMFLLWRHLEFYLVYCSPADGGLSLYQLTAQKQQLRSLTGSIVCCSCSCLLHFDQRFWCKGKRQITEDLPLHRKHSPDGATTDGLWQTSNCSFLLSYRPWRDERLSQPGWLTWMVYPRRQAATNNQICPEFFPPKKIRLVEFAAVFCPPKKIRIFK